MKLVNAYVEKLNPQIGAMWLVDEMKVKNGGQWSWLWNVMDEENRFMLVSTISKTRARGPLPPLPISHHLNICTDRSIP